jgi:hypothetical protein
VSVGAAAWILPPKLAARANTMLRIGAQALIFLGAVMLFSISPMMLTIWGIPYDSVGGSAPAKVHPATWTLLAGLGLASLRFSSPIAFAVRAASALPGVVAYLLSWAFLLWYAITVQKLAFTPLIDSLLMPVITLLALSTQTGAAKRRIAVALHALLFVNAALGLAEYLMGFHLTPRLEPDGVTETDWRSTALLGHPLGNAVVMGSYIIILSVGGGRDLPRALRPLLALLAMASMIAFGGRTSLVLSLVSVAGVMFARFVGVLRGARVDVAMASGAAALAPVILVGLIWLYGSGFFDQMIERFVNDNGSARARIVMLNMFQQLSWNEIMFGVNPEKMLGLQRLEGVEYGLESFFVAYALAYGAIVASVFFVGVACFCREMARASTMRAIVPILFFFVVAATSVSLSAKTTTLGMLVALLLTMLRPRGEGELA